MELVDGLFFMLFLLPFLAVASLAYLLVRIFRR